METIIQQKENVSSFVSETKRRDLTPEDIVQIISGMTIEEIRMRAAYIHKRSLIRYFIMKKFPKLKKQIVAEFSGVSCSSACDYSKKTLEQGFYDEILEYVEKKIETFCGQHGINTTDKRGYISLSQKHTHKDAPNGIPLRGNG